MSALRVQIHLNLANPELAESVVRIKSQTGAWISVGYATEIVLGNAIPVIDEKAREKISEGGGKKTPHAFIEGDLLHFKGRLRDKAPEYLKSIADRFFIENVLFDQWLGQAQKEDVKINYNPRFATCFYRDRASKEDINEEYLSANKLMAVGWLFLAQEASFSALPQSKKCDVSLLERVSVFEKRALSLGRATTEALLAEPVVPSRRKRFKP